jgi:hypothetical protein
VDFTSKSKVPPPLAPLHIRMAQSIDASEACQCNALHSACETFGCELRCGWREMLCCRFGMWFGRATCNDSCLNTCMPYVPSIEVVHTPHRQAYQTMCASDCPACGLNVRRGCRSARKRVHFKPTLPSPLPTLSAAHLPVGLGRTGGECLSVPPCSSCHLASSFP